MKVIIVDGKQYDLLSLEEAMNTPLEPKRCFVYIGERFYPISFTMADAYVAPEQCLYLMPAFAYIPVDDGDPKWNISNYRVIDFDNAVSMADMYAQTNKLSELTKESLIPDADDKLDYYEITNDQSNLLQGLLQFINSKQILCRRYADRFDNYPNTIRILGKDKITIDKFMEFMNNMDGKATIIIENADDDVANPIPKPIVIEL